MLPLLDEYLHAKNHVYPYIPSRNIDELKLWQSDWMWAFWYTTFEVAFSWI